MVFLLGMAVGFHSPSPGKYVVMYQMSSSSSLVCCPLLPLPPADDEDDDDMPELEAQDDFEAVSEKK